MREERFRPRHFESSHHWEQQEEDEDFGVLGDPVIFRACCIQREDIPHEIDGPEIPSLIMLVRGEMLRQRCSVMVPMVVEPEMVDHLIDALQQWRTTLDPHIHVVEDEDPIIVY